MKTGYQIVGNWYNYGETSETCQVRKCELCKDSLGGMTLSCDNILAPEWDDQVFDPYTSMNTGSHQKASFRFPDSYGNLLHI